MNILYITTVFPEHKDTSTIYTDLAEELGKIHNVTVVTNIERNKKQKTYISEERNCLVLRVKTGNQYNVNIIEKGLTLITIDFLLIRAIKKYFKGSNFDLILYESPPVTLSNVVKYAKRKYKSRTFLMLKDIFPQNAVDLGIFKRNSLLYRYFRLKERELYNISDKIGCMSKGNLEYINKHNNINMDKLTIFPNTKKYKKTISFFRDQSILSKYNIPHNKVLFVFGGNMGKPQGIDFLGDCIVQSQDIEEAFFVLVGRGTEKYKLKHKLKKAKNAIVLDSLPRDNYELLLQNCDVGIICLDYRFTIPNYPSRILSYMEYKKPVLALTDEATDFKNLVLESNCGMWSPSNSIESFKNNVLKLLNKDLRDFQGENGYNYFLNNFLVDKSVNILNTYLKEK